MIKLTDMLFEIGDRVLKPKITKDTIGVGDSEVWFIVDGVEYVAELAPRQFWWRMGRVEPVVGSVYVSFRLAKAAKDDYDLTGAGIPLKMVGSLIGVLMFWAEDFYMQAVDKRDFDDGTLKVKSLIYDPKEESGESGDGRGMNKRDRLYRMFIQKFAKQRGSSVKFGTQGGIVAAFDPPITLYSK